MVKILGKSLQSVKNKLRQLEEMGLVEKRKTCWMVTSQDMVVALAGKKRNRKLDVAGFFGNASRMTTYAYATIVSKGAMRAMARQRKGKRSKTATAIPLAAKLTAKDCGRSEQTVHKQRARAKNLGMIDYDRDIHFFKDGNGQSPKFTDGLGGKFFFSKDGVLLHEGPALITELVKSKCVMIRPSLLDLASQRHFLLRQNG
jgi:predicted transcriptional regulator